MAYMHSNFSSLFFVILISLLCPQCKEDNPIQKEINSKHEEIMVIHDEVMPKMKDIYQLKKKLKKSLPNVQAEQLIVQLEQADELMMDWMAQYKKPKIDSDYETYLADQLKSVKVVKRDMLSSISNAQKHLNE